MQTRRMCAGLNGVYCALYDFTYPIVKNDILHCFYNKFWDWGNKCNYINEIIYKPLTKNLKAKHLQSHETLHSKWIYDSCFILYDSIAWFVLKWNSIVVSVIVRVLFTAIFQKRRHPKAIRQVYTDALFFTSNHCLSWNLCISIHLCRYFFVLCYLEIIRVYTKTHLYDGYSYMFYLQKDKAIRTRFSKYWYLFLVS